MNTAVNDNMEIIHRWQKDIFLFCEDTIGMSPAMPIKSLRGTPVSYKDEFGNDQTTVLFDVEGRLVYHDLSFYTRDMFERQDGRFTVFRGTRFTWQQTVFLEAYRRGVNTFGKDSYDIARRWITVRSGHGTGKTSTIAIVSLHFLVCFFGSQIQITANTEQQLKDVFMKEVSIWHMKLPHYLRENIEILDDIIRIKGSDDWFLRARVARPEKPESLAGIHGKYVLQLIDEASGVHTKVTEIIKGSLTGENFIVIYTSNPTRNEGEFFDSHKEGSTFTRLHFSSRESPIVNKTYIEKIESDYGKESDETKIRIDGDFAGVASMDDKGWMPLFENITLSLEAQDFQKIRHGVIGVDPAGKGRDTSVIGIRDAVYLKEVLNEKTSSPKDLARKIETIRDAYGCSTSDVGVDGFGIGSEVIANIRNRADELEATPKAILMDKPRENTEDFHTYKSELAWMFRLWVAKGGIIITNNQNAWVRELSKIKYKRDQKGRIMLMPKETFKKEHGFSPDRFDMACLTFFKEDGERPVHLTREQLQKKETMEWLARVQRNTQKNDNFSSM